MIAALGGLRLYSFWAAAGPASHTWSYTHDNCYSGRKAKCTYQAAPVSGSGVVWVTGQLGVRDTPWMCRSRAYPGVLAAIAKLQGSSENWGC